MPLIGETMHGEAIHYVPGGKGANQAAGCGRLGAEVSMIGAVGDDAFGRTLLQQMAGFGVRTDRIAVKLGVPTGTATILHTPEDNCIVIVAGANGTCSAEQVEANADAIRGADVLLVQLEVPLAAVQRAMELAKEGGARVVLNPAPARELPAELLRMADVVTPNETELAVLTGKPAHQLEAAIREWKSEYGGELVVTLGKEGCALLENDQLVRVPSVKVDVVDTTGAGDTFNAALSVMLAEGRSLRDAAAFAVRAAALSVTRFGAQGGLPTRSEVEALLP